MPFLRQFCESGRYTPEDHIDAIEARDRQAWAIVDNNYAIKAVALTQISNERVKTCHITLLAGIDRKSWQDAFFTVKEWAKSLGCSRIEALARPGWEKVGKQYGLRKTHVLLEADI